MITTALKYLFFIGVLAATIPFWLPTSLGGQTSYHFVLTDSMKGTVDPGAFVVLRSSDQYNEGDVVAYRQEFGDDDTEFTILHRIIARMPDGGFITKGDAVPQSETIEASQITGRMVAALPALGFLPGAFRAAPLIVGTALMLILVVGGAAFKKEKPSNAKKTARSTDLFIPASIVVVASIPYATLGVGEFLPTGAEAILQQFGAAPILETLPLSILLFGVIAIARMSEVLWAGPRGSTAAVLAEVNYAVVMLLAISTVPVSELMTSARSVLSF